MLSVSDAAGDDYYSYTITPEGHIVGDYNPIGTSSDGTWTSVGNTNSGSWTWDEDGYGPFNSYYAAFDPARDNLMVCHLDPFDLDYSVDHSMNISGLGYNVMWCLPTVYWLTDSSGNLVLTNDPDAGGVAYAHTIEGEVFAYVGFGVFEASTTTVDGETILTSTSGTTPLVSETRATFRDYANNQLVDADGGGDTGYAMVWNFYQWQLYKFCALAVMGTWDSQSVAGNGDVYGGNYTHPTGNLDQSGPYAGTRGSGTTYQQDSVKVFIENAWGGAFDFVDGIVFSNRNYYIDTSATPTDSISGTWITHPTGTLPSSSSGWGSSPSTTAQIWGMPTATSGSSSSGLCDYVYTSSGTYLLCVGGCSYTLSFNALRYGLSSAGCNYSLSYSSDNVGARLAFVFDADPFEPVEPLVFESNPVTDGVITPLNSNTVRSYVNGHDPRTFDSMVARGAQSVDSGSHITLSLSPNCLPMALG